jgi:hypothetical protein
MEKMKITIEPTEDQSRLSADTMHSKVSVSIASDDLDITDMMGQVVKALQAWGFHNESIAKELDEELAWGLGLQGKPPEETVTPSSECCGAKDKHKTSDKTRKTQQEWNEERHKENS